jgi:hypothetical protein
MSYQSISTTTPKAKKQHQCIWCGELILIGEIHFKEVGEYEGDFQSNRYHNECHSAADKYFKESGENCFDPYENKRGSTDEKSVVSERVFKEDKPIERGWLREVLDDVKKSRDTMTIPTSKFLEMKKKLDDYYDWLHLFVELEDGGGTLTEQLHKKYGDKYKIAYGWRTEGKCAESEKLNDGGKWVKEQLTNLNEFENKSKEANLVVGNKIEQILKTPSEWQKEMPEVIIIDIDGWRLPDAKDWNEPITRAEYLTRRSFCTCKFDIKKLKELGQL